MIDRLLEDAAAFFADPGVWWSWLVLSAMALLCLGVGRIIGQRVRLIQVGDGASWGSVGLALCVGLLALGVTYASIRSGGSSAYLPALIALLCAIALGRGPITRPRIPRRDALRGLATLAAMCAVGALYGMTLAPSIRDGVQPIEFMDEAFYAVLGAELRATGVEDSYRLAGFGDIPGFPEQSWYHWGEIWLAALALEAPGVSPMHARHLIVLPLLVVATTLVVGGTAARYVPIARRRTAFTTAAFGLLTVAPIPLIREMHFDWWARAIGFSITPYGLTYVVVALGLVVLIRPRLYLTPGGALFGAALTSALIASHVLIAAVGAVTVFAFGLWSLLQTRRASRVGALAVTAKLMLLGVTAVLATVAWGVATGHTFVGAGRVPGVQPFGESWARGVVLTVAGAGLLLVGPAIALRRRLVRPPIRWLGASAGIGAAAAAIAWGVGLADHNMFHVFFGAIAVVLTPVAVILTVVAATRARTIGARRTALALTALLLVQGSVGAGATLSRLYEFGPGNFEPVPVEALAYLRSLPEDAKLAYACGGFEEVAAWDPRLISLTAHTGRLVVPLCFQADLFGDQHGKEPDPNTMNPFFALAPQRSLYPSADAEPSTAQIAAFLRRYEIHFIWSSPDHPNRLIPDAPATFRSGDFSVHRLPLALGSAVEP